MVAVNGRDSKFELLRILSMVMIVAYHVSGSLFSTRILSTSDNIIIIIFGSWGILGVDLFVLLNCFFYFSRNCDNSNDIGIIGFCDKKIRKIGIQTFTYICAFTLLVPIFTDICMVDMLKVFITRMINDPLYSDGYWFISAYITLQFVLPYIKKLKVSKNLFLIDNILLFMSSQSNSKGFIPAAVHFILIAIFLLHVMKIPKLKYFFAKYSKVGFLITSFSMFAYTITIFLINENGLLVSGFSAYIGYFLNVIVSHAIYFHRCSYLIVIDSVFLFYWFLNLKPFKNKGVNVLASLMFGVYLFHQCPGYDIPNVTVGKLSQFITNNILLYAVSVLLIMIAGIIVETIRKSLFKVFNRFSILE